MDQTRRLPFKSLRALQIPAQFDRVQRCQPFYHPADCPELFPVPPPCRLGYAGAMFLDRESMSETACSAVLSVLPVGVFITTMPVRVAATLSMLSVPTPARAIARKCLLPSSASAVILTPLRHIAASNLFNASRSSLPASPVMTSYSIPSACSSKSGPLGRLNRGQTRFVFNSYSNAFDLDYRRPFTRVAIRYSCLKSCMTL